MHIPGINESLPMDTSIAGLFTRSRVGSDHREHKSTQQEPLFSLSSDMVFQDDTWILNC